MNNSINKNILTQNSFTNFAYNGMKLDNEVSGNGNSYTTLFRELDVRLGRWWAVDPKSEQMPWQSSFQIMSNNPVTNIDLNGDTDYYSLSGKKVGSDGEENGLIGVVHNNKIARQIRKGNFKLPENPTNGKVFSGGFIIHKDILSKSVEILKESITKGQDRELSTSMNITADGKGYTATPTIVGEPNENGREKIPIYKGEISIHSHPLGLKKIGRDDYKGSSTRPSDEIDGKVNDKEMFLQHQMNIIVGNSMEPKPIQGSPIVDQGELEIKVFGNNNKDLKGRISLKSADKIIKSSTKTD